MNHTEKTIPVWEKYSLNVSEAAEYYGIGEKRLRQIAGENEGADFILEVGSHIRFKRKLFEDYLDTASKDTGKKIYTTEVYANRIEFAGAKIVDRPPFPEDAEGFLEIPEGMEEEMPFR